MSSPLTKATDRPLGRPPVTSPFEYQRFRSREVRVGNVRVGGDNPIRLQSMTISDTMDTEATVREAIQLFEAGSEIVRITAPGPKDAENLRNIKEILLARGYDFPLVADIHFSPKAALIAVEYVEKVRINPGNFADKKKFKTIQYSDTEYEDELARVRETFRPLVLRAKELGRAMRIGTNHGSLSDRVMNRFGDTPLGMVESALEFIRFAREEDFHDIIVSMKASNPQVMVQAYRLLIERFYLEGYDYPLHLGVTEAGDGQDGRIKSAVGIGSLLDDGIGDTIRVSLTEDAVYEIPAARRIAAPYNRPADEIAAPARLAPACESRLSTLYPETVNPYMYSRFLSEAVQAGEVYLGSKHQHRIVLPVALAAGESPAQFATRLVDYRTRGADAVQMIANVPVAGLLETANALAAAAGSPGVIFDFGDVSRLNPTDDAQFAALIAHPATAGIAITLDFMQTSPERTNAATRAQLEPRIQTILVEILRQLDAAPSPRALFVHFKLATLDHLASIETWLKTSAWAADPRLVFSIECEGTTTKAYRALIAVLTGLERSGTRSLSPVLLRPTAQVDVENTLYDAAVHAGGLFLDGIGDALQLSLPTGDESNVSEADVSEALLGLSLDLLQGVRLRLSKTEFISCPSCGRTLFDLQTTTARIKAKTGHLKGVKIAVMGCIVNGPGEMADAEFGYVGAAPGNIHLYKGKEIVKPNIPSNIADEELVNLLKESGVWRDPES